MSDILSEMFQSKNDEEIEEYLDDINLELTKISKDKIKIIDDNSFEEVIINFSSFKSIKESYNYLAEIELKSLPLDYIDKDRNLKPFSKNISGNNPDSYKSKMQDLEKGQDTIIINNFTLKAFTGIIIGYIIESLMKALHQRNKNSPEIKSEEISINPSWGSKYLTDVNNDINSFIIASLVIKLSSIKNNLKSYLQKIIALSPQLKQFREDESESALIEKIIDHYKTVINKSGNKIKIFQFIKLPESISDLFAECIICILDDYKLAKEGELRNHLANNKGKSHKNGKKGYTVKYSRSQILLIMILLKEQGFIRDNINISQFTSSFSELTGYSKNTLRNELPKSAGRVVMEHKQYDDLIEAISNILEELRRLK